MHFKQTNHSTNSIFIQPVEKILMMKIPLKEKDIILDMNKNQSG